MASDSAHRLPYRYVPRCSSFRRNDCCMRAVHRSGLCRESMNLGVNTMVHPVQCTEHGCLAAVALADKANGFFSKAASWVLTLLCNRRVREKSSSMHQSPPMGAIENGDGPGSVRSQSFRVNLGSAQLFLQRRCNGLELGQSSGEVLDDFPGDDVGRGQVFQVLHGVVA